MNEIDTEKIKKITNNLIGYSNFEKEERMKKNKLKNIAFTFLALFIVIGGTISVDALTDNKISDAIKSVLNVKVDGQDKNASCEKLNNGNIKCKLDKDILGDGEFSLETDNVNRITDIQYNHTEKGDEVLFNINDLKE